MRTPNASGNVASPEFGDIAVNLAAIADILPGEDNRHRQALRDVVASLRGRAPDLDAATRHVMLAMFDLGGGGKMVDKPETWLLSAILICIAGEKHRVKQAIVVSPPRTMQ